MAARGPRRVARQPPGVAPRRPSNPARRGAAPAPRRTSGRGPYAGASPGARGRMSAAPPPGVGRAAPRGRPSRGAAARPIYTGGALSMGGAARTARTARGLAPNPAHYTPAAMAWYRGVQRSQGMGRPAPNRADRLGVRNRKPSTPPPRGRVSRSVRTMRGSKGGGIIGRTLVPKIF